jgi:hypothetical protein
MRSTARIGHGATPPAFCRISAFGARLDLDLARNKFGFRRLLLSHNGFNREFAMKSFCCVPD